MKKRVAKILSFTKMLLICSLFFGASLSFAQEDIFEISRSGSIEDITSLYKNDKASIDKKNEQGYTPLTLACYSGNIEVATFLAEKVENIDGNSNYGTPLMAAVYKNQAEIVEVLLNNNADPNIQDSQGGTAMHYAVLFKNYKIIELLKEADADFTIKNNVKKSAQDFAISYKDKKLNELLNL